MPIGNVDQEVIERIRKMVIEIFGVPTKAKGCMEEPVYAFDPAREQFYSTKILKMMIKDLPGDGLKIIGITDVDLYTPVLTFVFGEAQLDGKAAVVSLARLNPKFYGLPPNDGLMMRRALKEVVHELGHTFGLTHCESSECAMYLSNSVKNIDAKEETFCPVCQGLIRYKIYKQEG